MTVKITQQQKTLMLKCHKGKHDEVLYKPASNIAFAMKIQKEGEIQWEINSSFVSER